MKYNEVWNITARSFNKLIPISHMLSKFPIESQWNVVKINCKIFQRNRKQTAEFACVSSNFLTFMYWKKSELLLLHFSSEFLTPLPALQRSCGSVSQIFHFKNFIMWCRKICAVNKFHLLVATGSTGFRVEFAQCHMQRLHSFQSSVTWNLNCWNSILRILHSNSLAWLNVNFWEIL